MRLGVNGVTRHFSMLSQKVSCNFFWKRCNANSGRDFRDENRGVLVAKYL